MRTVFLISCLLVPTAASAHPGHFADLAGHSHWIALGALAAAGALTAWIAGQKDKNRDEDEEDAEEVDGAADEA